MKVEIRTLTPAVARALLTGSKTKNRLINKSMVKIYQQDMMNNRWIENGQTITLSDDGSVLDGHHRLHALKDCPGVSISVPVVTVSNDRAIETIDVGRPRTVADFFEMKLGLNGLLALLAGHLQSMIQGHNLCQPTKRDQFEQLKNLYYKYETGFNWALWNGWELGKRVGRRTKCKNNIRPGARSAALIWAGLGAIHAINEDLAEFILEDLSCDASRKSELGIAFNNVMLSHINRPSDRHSGQWVKERYIIGLNHYMSGTTASFLRRSVNQKAPRLRLELINETFGGI